MAELCPAFLADDFEAAAREADAAVGRLYEVASDAAAGLSADRLITGEAASTWLERQPEWREAQAAVQRQFRARAALEHTGLPLPAAARQAADRAQNDFAVLGQLVARGELPRSRPQE